MCIKKKIKKYWDYIIFDLFVYTPHSSVYGGGAAYSLLICPLYRYSVMRTILHILWSTGETFYRCKLRNILEQFCDTIEVMCELV